MYDYLSGNVVEKGRTWAVVDVGGVGYRLTVSQKCSDHLPETGSVKLFVHLHVRDDDLRLYGFSSRAERTAFDGLLSVSGVGPAMAIQILSHLSSWELRQAIVNEDTRRITGARGVGPKTAKRIVLDLKGTWSEMPPESFGIDTTSLGGGPSIAAAKGPFEEALSALLALGYSRAGAESALRQALSSAADATAESAESLLRRALRVG